MTIRQVVEAGYDIRWNPTRTIPTNIKLVNGKWTAFGPEILAPAFEVIDIDNDTVVGVGKTKGSAIKDFEERILSLPCTVKGGLPKE